MDTNWLGRMSVPSDTPDWAAPQEAVRSGGVSAVPGRLPAPERPEPGELLGYGVLIGAPRGRNLSHTEVMPEGEALREARAWGAKGTLVEIRAVR